MQIGNKMFYGVSGKLLEIHRNKRCEAVSSRELEQIHRKSVSQTGGWYVELEQGSLTPLNACMRLHEIGRNRVT